MATALIQFQQGAHTDAAGKAVLGVHGEFSTVEVTNGDNTGVVSWKVYVLDAPPDSVAFPPEDLPVVLAQAASSTPSATFEPDAAGTYRVMLEVVDNTAQVDRDIRCFGIPDARGFVRPPYQENPPPLPILLPSVISDGPRPVKPDEQNYGDNTRGWAGNGAAGQLDDFLRRYDDLPHEVVDTTPFTATASGAALYIVDLDAIGGSAAFTLPETPRVGFVVRIAVLAGAPDDVATVSPANGGDVWDAPNVEILGNSTVVLVHRGGDDWVTLSEAAPEPEAAVLPLTNVYYVDQASTAPSPDGSIAAPYATLQAAIDASFSAVFIEGRKLATIIVAPGEYGACLFPSDAESLENNYDASVTIQAMAPGTVFVDSLGSLTPAYGFAVTLIGLNVAEFSAADVGPSVAQITLSLVDCVVSDAGAGLDLVGDVDALRTQVSAEIAIADGALRAIDCAFTDVSTITANSIVLRRSTLDAGTVVASTLELDRSSVSNVVLTGSLQASYSTFQLSCDGSVNATYCQTSGFDATGNAGLSFCTIEGTVSVSAGDLSLTSSHLKVIDITVSGDAQMHNVRRDGVVAGVTVGGTLTIDSISYWQLAGFALTAGQVAQSGFGSVSIPIIVPAVAAGEVGYAEGTLVGSTAEGVYFVNTPITVNPSGDLEAAGPGGGLINARMSANDTVRCTFIGPLTGGSHMFTVSSNL